MPRIELENLLQGFANVDPAFVNMTKAFYALFDGRGAANRRITNVEPLFYWGASAGSEFLTYAATKMYLCMNFTGGGNTATANITGFIRFYDESDGIRFAIANTLPFWDGTLAAVWFQSNDCMCKNLFFSRIVVQSYSRIMFNGFRVTLAT